MVDVFAPEELVPRIPLQKQQTLGTITKKLVIQEGESLYEVAVRHPVTQKEIHLPRVRASTPRHYPSDQDHWEVGARVLLRQYSRTGWEIIGTVVSPALWGVEPPPASMALHSSRMLLHEKAIALSRGLEAVAVDDEGVQLGTRGVLLRIGDDRVSLVTPGTALASQADGSIKVLNPTTEEQADPLYLPALEGSEDLTLMATVQTVNVGNHGSHTHEVEVELPFFLVKALRVDKNAAGVKGANPPGASPGGPVIITPPANLEYTQVHSRHTVVGGEAENVVVNRYRWGMSNPPSGVDQDNLSYQLQTFSRIVDSSPEIATVLGGGTPTNYNYERYHVDVFYNIIGGVTSADDLLYNSVFETIGPFLGTDTQLASGILYGERVALMSSANSVISQLGINRALDDILTITPSIDADGRVHIYQVSGLPQGLARAQVSVFDQESNTLLSLAPEHIDRVILAGYRVRTHDSVGRVRPSIWGTPFALVGYTLKDSYRHVTTLGIALP